MLRPSQQYIDNIQEQSLTYFFTDPWLKIVLWSKNEWYSFSLCICIKYVPGQATFSSSWHLPFEQYILEMESRSRDDFYFVCTVNNKKTRTPCFSTLRFSRISPEPLELQKIYLHLFSSIFKELLAETEISQVRWHNKLILHIGKNVNFPIKS